MNNEELYRQNIIDHYKHPLHKGIPDDCSVQSQASNPTCGDNLVLYIILNKEHIVKEALFDGDGCAISTAAADMLVGYIKGKTIDRLKLVTPGDVYNMLGVQISPARVNCALLAYKALQDVLEKPKTRESRSNLDSLDSQI